ncbi:MAG: hypothetical protein K0V04_02860 [Deltaproteobacteria bacterium]|nr:hypothetical protein [Deltaproteobacteria bacterium]
MREVGRRALALGLGTWLGACHGDDRPQEAGLDPSPPTHDPAAVEACRGDAESFVMRSMPLLHGRRPLGSTEVRVLGNVVEQLEARGRDGRHVLARALADGDDYRRRWGSVLLDLLGTHRDGHRALGGCYGQRGPAAESDALARFVLAHPPEDAFAGGPFSMRDLIESSLRADDLRPVLRADLLVRMVLPIDDANTSPDDLERARRTNFGRGFEAVYLGRRFECLACHRDEASVTDHPDPALDRFWPVAQGLERLVYSADEDSLHAGFRFEGFADGEVEPWGLQGCGAIVVGRDDDPMPAAAYLAGPLPSGAHALDVQARLDAGLERLAERGWSDAPTDADQALGQLVVLNLVDGIWAAATGHRLTLDHGAPRNAAQAERLRVLAIAFVEAGYSLRAVLIAIAADPAIDQAVPSRCEVDGPEPLPPLFDPFTDENGVGHRVHRRDPFALYDEAHRVIGRALPGMVVHQPGFDAERVASLGAHLDESRPGHDGLDLLGSLTWERALVSLPQAPPQLPSPGPSVALDELIEAAGRDPATTVGDLMVAVKDRVLTEPEVDAEERALVETLVGQPWARPTAQLDAPTLHAIAWRYARALMATPAFLLQGLEHAPGGRSPRLRTDATDPAKLCAYWAPRLLPGEPWTCTDFGVAVP